MKEFIYCQVSEERIDPSSVFSFTQSHGLGSHGAQNFFFGSVRAHNAGREVVAVGYDAFTPLAEKTLRDIAIEAEKTWGQGIKIIILHRIGKLSVGEISVGIGVSTPHRNEAYQVSRYIIEQIKVRAPIWKKEYYINGETEWLKGHALCQGHSNDQHQSHRVRVHGAHSHQVQDYECL